MSREIEEPTTSHEPNPGLVERIFDTGEVSLNYAEGPQNGPPLVLLHGLGRRWQVFLPIIPAFSLRWHIFIPDLRGHGKSSHVARGYRGPQFSGDIAKLLRERIGKPAVLFGHSLGGMLAMSIASTHGDLVRALVLGDNMIVGRDLRHPMYTALFAGLRDAARTGGSVEHIAKQIGSIILPVPGTSESLAIRELPGNDEPYLLAWARCVQMVDPETYEMTLDGSSLEGWDGEKVLREINCPTLLLQGAPQMGGLMSDSDAALAARILPHHAHVKFKNLGHALFIQQPEPVLRAVTNFLESLELS